MKAIRSHSQKFLGKLVRLLNNKRTKIQLSKEEAQFYYEILNQKLNKWMNKNFVEKKKNIKEHKPLETKEEQTLHTARSNEDAQMED